MNTLYKKEIIHEIQKAINSGKYGIVYHDNYDFMSSLYVFKILMKLVTEQDGRRDMIVYICDTSVDSAYLKEWHSFAPGKFVKHDFIKDTKDMLGHVPYAEIEYSSHDSFGNSVVMRCIVRDLREVNDAAADSEGAEEMIKMYGDLKIGDKYYSVIKICEKDDAFGYATTKMYGNSIEVTAVDENSDQPDEQDADNEAIEIPMSDVEDEIETDALF